MNNLDRILKLLAVACAAIYTLLVFDSLPWLLNPRFTMDDALQQSFPLHSVLYPEMFKDDIIWRGMRGYLLPIHWALSSFITMITADPVMTGHIIMASQLVISAAAITSVVYLLAGTIPACFALCFWLHTRAAIERMCGGFPRGWAPALLAIFLYLLIKKRYRPVLVVISISFFLYPQAAVIAGATYGLYLAAAFLNKDSRASVRRHFIEYLIVVPLMVVACFLSLKQPPEIGQMVNYKEASEMPEYRRGGGRFALVPFPSAVLELKKFPMRVFSHRWDPASRWVRENALWLTCGVLLGMILVQLALRREIIPHQLIFFLSAILIIYSISRPMAFLLYIPDRHIQFPMFVFLIISLTVGFWRLMTWGPNSPQQTLRGIFGLLLLGSFVVYSGGSGLKGNPGFHVQRDYYADIYNWLRDNTKQTDLVAGTPRFVDGVQLFVPRRIYISYETAHPFYKEYYKEAKRRIIAIHQAYFAKNAQEFLDNVEPDGIDYVLVKRSDFAPGNLKRIFLFRPFTEWLQEYVKRCPAKQFFLPRALASSAEFIAFKDRRSFIVDVAKLKSFVAANPESPLLQSCSNS